MAQFDPSNAGVDEVLAKLEKADDAERQRILTAEQGGKKRKTVLEPYGIDPDARVSASGRTLYPWEVDADAQTFAVVVDDDPEQQAARKAQAEQDELVAAAQSDQGGSTAPGSGVAPVGVADAGVGGDAGTVSTGGGLGGL